MFMMDVLCTVCGAQVYFFNLVTLTFAVWPTFQKFCPGLWLESEELIIFSIFIWLPQVSFVIFLTTLVLIMYYGGQQPVRS